MRSMRLQSARGRASVSGDVSRRGSVLSGGSASMRACLSGDSRTTICTTRPRSRSSCATSTLLRLAIFAGRAPASVIGRSCGRDRRPGGGLVSDDEKAVGWDVRPPSGSCLGALHSHGSDPRDGAALVQEDVQALK